MASKVKSNPWSCPRPWICSFWSCLWPWKLSQVLVSVLGIDGVVLDPVYGLESQALVLFLSSPSVLLLLGLLLTSSIIQYSIFVVVWSLIIPICSSLSLLFFCLSTIRTFSLLLRFLFEYIYDGSRSLYIVSFFPGSLSSTIFHSVCNKPSCSCLLGDAVNKRKSLPQMCENCPNHQV